MANLPAEALELLSRQFGVVGRHQLRRLSMSRGVVDNLVSRGSLIPVERGVYRVRGGACMPEQSAMAAVLRARPGARVTGPFVLGALEVDGFSRRDPFEVLVRPGRRLTGVSFRFRPDPTPDAGWGWLEGLPIVTPTAALVDSGRFVDELGTRRLRLGLDACRWRRLTTTERVLQRAELLGPRDPGARFFLALYDEDLLRPESEGERRLGRLLLAYEPPPEPQVWVTPNRRVDWFWRDLRLAPEYQGALDHAQAEARLRDRERGGELAALGILVVPVVDADLEDKDGFHRWMDAVLLNRAVARGLEPPRRGEKP